MESVEFREWCRQAKERELREAYSQIAALVRAGELTEAAANDWRVELEERAFGGGR